VEVDCIGLSCRGACIGYLFVLVRKQTEDYAGPKLDGKMHKNHQKMNFVILTIIRYKF
jgi:hypothetical protein